MADPLVPVSIIVLPCCPENFQARLKRPKNIDPTVGFSCTSENIGHIRWLRIGR